MVLLAIWILKKSRTAEIAEGKSGKLEATKVSREPLIKSVPLRLTAYLFLLFGAFAIGILISACIGLAIGGSHPLLAIGLAAFVLYVYLAVSTLLFVLLVERVKLAEIGLPKAISYKQLCTGIFLAILFLLIEFGICTSAGWLKLVPNQVPEPYFVWLIVACAIIGFTEELIYRGYLLYVFEKWKGRTVAIILTSILFWIPHISNGSEMPALAAVGYLMFGVAQCFNRYAFGNLYFAIGFHAFYDLLALGTGQGGKDVPGYFNYLTNAPGWLLGPAGDTGLMDLLIPFGFLLLYSIWSYKKSLKADFAGVSNSA